MLRTILAALAVSTASGWSYAQCSSCTTDPPIKVKAGDLGGSLSVVDCHSAGSNFSVDVGTLTHSTGDILIQIYDCASPPTHNIGIVTITGDTTGLSSIAVLVASSGQTWSDTPAAPLSAGCVNLAGLVADNSTRSITRASVAVSGNIEHHTSGANPDLHANQFVWVQANSSGGSIAANITADGGTLYSGATAAILHVRAYDTMSGAIVASAKDIGQIRVIGPASGTPGGIQGSISAASGTIDQIWTSGPIGLDASHRSTITAGKRIGMITCRNDQATTVEAKNFFANVEASDLGVADTAVGSSFSLIETDGDFNGSLHLFQFDAQANGGNQPHHNSATGTTNRCGIFVGGKFEGDITVDKDYSHGDMIARSFRGTITIGKFFEGCIVAVGHEGVGAPDGTITAVSIGNNGIAAGQGENLHGFSGKSGDTIMQPSFEGSEAHRSRWYSEAAGSTSEPVIDSVIRADVSIGSVDIYAMSNNLYAGFHKDTRPRVESPRIDSLTIRTAMDAGVVWSGVLNNLAYHGSEDDINDDYASIGTMSVGCIGPMADLWVQDCPSMDFHTIAQGASAAGDVFGEIHMGEVVSSQRLRIGGRFGDLDQVGNGATPCDPELSIYDWNSNGVRPVESSPRGYWADEDLNSSLGSGIADYSRIRVQAIEGLHGQVVLNADGTGGPSLDDEADYWRGDVEVGTGDPHATPTRPPPEVYSTLGRETTDRAGPYYAEHSVTDGGGSIGLVRYHLHGEDCIPEQDSSVCWMPTGSWPGYGTREIAKGALYGKVIDTVTGDSNPPVVVKRQSLICSTCPPPWEDVTSTCLVLSAQGSNGREFWVAYNNGVHMFPDMYNWSIAARVDEDHVADLKCGDTFLNTAPDVSKFEYKFTLSSLPCWELPTFSEEDPAAWADGNGYYTIESWEVLVQVDLNRDGVLDEQDLLDLLHRLELD